MSEMQPQELFIDSLAEALTETVSQIGGAKKVGAELWPEKSMEEARRTLLNSLNPEHSQKLSLEQVDLILGMARQKDVHTPFKYLADRYGYRLEPITPEDRKADIEQQMAGHMERIEHLWKEWKRTQGKK